MGRSRGIPVSNLARDLGISTGEMRRRLVECRMVRHVRPDGSIGADQVDEVLRAIKRVHADPRMSATGGLATDFDALMANQGIQKMGNDPRGRAPRTAKPAPKPQKAQRPTVHSGGGSRNRREDVLAEQVRDLQKQLDTALDSQRMFKSELEQARTELESRKGLLAQTLDTTETLASHSQALRNRLETLEAEEQRRRAGLSLESLLRSRGLTGEDERSAAVRALIQTRRWPQISAQLKPLDQEGLTALFERYVLLHCGHDDCPTPASIATVTVSRRRCELCGGHGQRVAMLRFSEALMLHGIRRLAVVGGTPAYQRVLRDGLDRRIECRLLLADDEPGESPPRLVVDWDPSGRTRDLTRVLSGGARRIQVRDRSLAGMLDAVREHLEAL